MSINNIQLTPNMLADLFPGSLVETNTTSVPESKEIQYLGNNQKNILVVVLHQSVPFLPDEELKFLTNILAACKLSIADIAIINHFNLDERDIRNIIDSEKTVLLFGVDPLSIGLPINFPQFQLQQFNKRTYLHAPGLSQIENDKALKSKLWNTLKVLFAI